MKTLMCILCLVSGLLTLPMFGEETWMRGSVAVIERSPSIRLKLLDTGAHVDAGAVTSYMSALIDVSSEALGELSLRASNRVSIYFDAPGSLAIERLDEKVLGSQGNGQSGISQMQMTLRSGGLVIDGRELTDGSTIVLETPLGRVSSSASLWSIKLDFNPLSRSYDLILECFEGSLRFVRSEGEKYDLPSGRSLLGVGGVTSVSFEVTKISDAGRELAQALLKASEQAEASYSEESLRSFMRPLRKVVSDDVSDQLGASGSRPIIIDYSPKTQWLVPFRGLVAEPTDHQSGLF